MNKITMNISKTAASDYTLLAIKKNIRSNRTIFICMKVIPFSPFIGETLFYTPHG
jgi:hypothetical protein